MVRRTKISMAAIVMALVLCILPVATVRADSVQVKPYIAFGADLNSSQRQKVMDLLAVTEEELADYETIEVTNQDEHEYLDSYLDKSVIGTKALSSVKVEESDEGGVEVETYNITFCTEEMYTNAFVTAGISDAEVTVAAPFEISGTAALVGAMKAYAVMTGEEVDQDKADAATNELVVTGDIAETIGKEEATEVVALVKDKVVSDDLSSEEEIMGAIDSAAGELNVSLTEENKRELAELMQKISDLDLDLDTLQKQAQGIYDELKELDIDMDAAQSVWEKISAFFASLFEKIADFFRNLF